MRWTSHVGFALVFVAAMVAGRARAANTPPTANTQTVPAAEDTPLVITLTGNDPDGDELNATIVEDPHGGILLKLERLRYRYTPNRNWNGTDDFKFKLSDGTADSAEAVVTVNVSPKDDPPQVKDVSCITKKNTQIAVFLEVLDPDGSSGLTCKVSRAPDNGQATIVQGDHPKLVYTPKQDWTGTDHVLYQASDGKHDSGPAAVTVEVVETEAGGGWIRFGSTGSYHVVRASIDGAGSITCTDAEYLAYVRYFTVPESQHGHPDFVAGTDAAKIRALEVDNALNKQVFASMFSCTGEWFTFKSGPEAAAAVEMRIQAINKMNQLNAKLENADPVYCYRANANANYETSCTLWTHLWIWRRADGTEARSAYYKETQASTSSYDAIMQMCKTTARHEKTVGECLGGAVACIWWGSAKAMGKTDFDKAVPFGKLNMDWFLAPNEKRPPPIWYNASWVARARNDRIHIAGDWLYMKNHNYNEIYKHKPFRKKVDFGDKKPLLPPNHVYLLSGENAFYMGKNAGGKDVYGGLGMATRLEKDMREELRAGYNDDFARLINARAQDGVTRRFPKIVEIEPKDAPELIKWAKVDRIHNPTSPNVAPYVADQVVEVLANGGQQTITLWVQDEYVKEFVGPTWDKIPDHGLLVPNSLRVGYANGAIRYRVKYLPDTNFSGVDEFRFKAGDGELQSNTGTVVVIVHPEDGSPVADARVSPSSGKAPLEVAFSAANSRDAKDAAVLEYSWNFGDGQKGSGLYPEHTYAKPGTYTATLTVTDSDGKTGTATAKVVVE